MTTKSEETPFEIKNCYDCSSLFSKVSWWCGNKEAIEYRGTSIPGVTHCPYWSPDWNYIDKKYHLKQYGFDDKIILVN
ncbi:MAG: hypothetical protein AABX88_00640 [Nanoarchaeota archaeon]